MGSMPLSFNHVSRTRFLQLFEPDLLCAPVLLENAHAMLQAPRCIAMSLVARALGAMQCQWLPRFFLQSTEKLLQSLPQPLPQLLLPKLPHPLQPFLARKIQIPHIDHIILRRPRDP